LINGNEQWMFVAGIPGFLLQGESQGLADRNQFRQVGASCLQMWLNSSYLKLGCILYISSEKNNSTEPVIIDQGLDLRAWRETVEADSKQLNELSMVCSRL
jgi:hypothetical protein